MYIHINMSCSIGVVVLSTRFSFNTKSFCLPRQDVSQHPIHFNHCHTKYAGRTLLQASNKPSAGALSCSDAWVQAAVAANNAARDKAGAALLTCSDAGVKEAANWAEYMCRCSLRRRWHCFIVALICLPCVPVILRCTDY
jgi:hypothetical protein